MNTFLSLIVLISASLTIYAKTRENDSLQFVFKPLAMAAIILLVVLNLSSPPSFYQKMILAGLILSTAGDVFLIKQQRFFVHGLISFLLGHLCYIAAFWAMTIQPDALNRLAFAAVIYLIYLGIFLKILWSRLSSLKIPVVVYSVVLVTMSALALHSYFSNPNRFTVCAFLGSVVFVVSDSILALNKFGKPIPLAQFWILGTYFLAQWLIAHSVVFF